MIILKPGQKLREKIKPGMVSEFLTRPLLCNSTTVLISEELGNYFKVRLIDRETLLSDYVEVDT